MIRPLAKAPAIPGVYVIYQDDAAVYVGQSTNVAKRVRGVLTGDSVAVLPIKQRARRLAVEATLISALDPPGNTRGRPTKRAQVRGGGKRATVSVQRPAGLREISVTLRPEVYRALVAEQARIKGDGGDASLQHLINESIARATHAGQPPLPAEARP